VIRLRLCRVAEVPPGEMRGFAVAGVAAPILVANLGGVLHATASTCPHEVVSLLDGHLERGRVVCPGHGYAFDLASGRCSHDPSLRLPRHQIEIVGDEVYVILGIAPT
jgi:nitrite reductase (NADH) small subunit